jgi:MinD superfamily P-loop ATPase
MNAISSGRVGAGKNTITCSGHSCFQERMLTKPEFSKPN